MNTNIKVKRRGNADSSEIKDFANLHQKDSKNIKSGEAFLVLNELQNTQNFNGEQIDLEN